MKLKYYKKSLYRRLIVFISAILMVIVGGVTTNAWSLPTRTNDIPGKVFEINNFQNNQIKELSKTRIASLEHLTSGSIVVDFSTTQTSGVGAIFSASDTTVSSRNLTIAVKNGHLYWEVRNDGSEYRSKLDAEDAWVADGRNHQVVVNVAKSNTSIFLDGQQVYSTTGIGFFGNLSSINRIAFGDNQNNGGKEWYFAGNIVDAKFYSTPLTDNQIKSLYHMPSVIDQHDSGQFEVSNEVRKSLNDRNISYILDVSMLPQDKPTTLLSFNRDSTIVQSVVYSKKSLIVNQGGRSLTINGNWNSTTYKLAFSINQDSIKVYADGSLVARGNLGSRSLPTVNNIQVQNAKLSVYAGSLNEQEIQTIVDYAKPHEEALFDSGFDGAASYRIPSLLYTTKGTLIAGADQRIPSAHDSPNDINFVIRRSTDEGKTWQNIQKVIDLPGQGRQAASVIDSTLTENRETGLITAVIDLFPGGYGQPNNMAGTGLTEGGNLKLYARNGDVYEVLPDGTVNTSNSRSTNYRVKSDGTVLLSNKVVGNYYAARGSSLDSPQNLRMYGTSYLIMVQSFDDGLTWTKPKFISNQVKESWMKFLGTGPGRAISLTEGEHKGRILVPVYYSNLHNVYSSAVIYSDDNGITWHRAKSPNDSRIVNGHVIGSQNLVGARYSLHEATIVETGNDEITMFMRNLNPGRRIGVSRSFDGGVTWQAPTFDARVPDIFSQPNVTNIDSNLKDIVFANASANRGYRGQGVLRLSTDGGQTWEKARIFNSGHYVYQSMAALPNGRIALLWEREWQGVYFSVVPKAWLEQSPLTYIN